MTRNTKNAKLLVAVLVVAAFAASTVFTLPSAAQTSTTSNAKTGKRVFPDEFSDLDRGNNGAIVQNIQTGVDDELNKARQKYLMALSAIERGDTVTAAKRFESAVEVLMQISGTEGIQENSDYTELVQVVLEDYDTYVTNLDLLNEKSAIAQLRRNIYSNVGKPLTSAAPAAKGRNPLQDIPKTTVPLTMTDDVERSIQFLTTNKGRSFMTRVLERSGRWLPTLYRIAKEEGMPPEIVYVAFFESGLNDTIVSRAKAVGMWQFIQSTGKMYDLEYNTWVDERRDVEKATRAAMHFLKDLYDDLGSWHLAMAAYNCGPGGVRRAQRRARIPGGDFWEIQHKLPKETRGYVPMFIAVTMITRDPEKYGFNMDSLNFHAPYQYESVTITEPVNLSTLAECANIPTDSLKRLNAELRKDCTPPNTSYKLKIPVGTKQHFVREFAKLSTDQKQPWIVHTVKGRETLNSIASDYGVSASDLAAINDIKGYKKRIRSGSTVRVPVTAQSQLASAETAPSEPEAVKPANTKKTVVAKSEPVVEKRTTHVVRSGESLTSIANRYNVSVSDLRDWNDITSRRGIINPGDRLVVNVIDEPVSNSRRDAVKVNQIVRHKVQRGETLGQIAAKYGTSVTRLRQLNGMSSRSVLQAGTSLKIESNGSSQRSVASSSRGSLPKTYKVRRGDTLSSIAGKFGLSIADIRSANPQLRNSDIVKIGQRLRLQ